MRKTTKAVIGFVATPFLAFALALISISTFGLRPWETETSQFWESLHYVWGVWLGYIFWGGRE